MARAILLAALTLAACTAAPVVPLPYRQEFSAPLGREWQATGGGWRAIDGRLFNDGARNVPLWLNAALPADVRVSFTAEAKSAAGDVKVELFGDGRSHESGYIVILAGWNNSRSIIARLAEHGERYNPVRTPERSAALRAEVARDPDAARAAHRDQREIIERPATIEPDRVYRLRVERRGHELTFHVDDVLHLTYFDPSPLAGPGHDRFAFNNWASPVLFDDLLIEPL